MMSDSRELPSVEPRCYPDRVLCDRHGFHQVLLGLEGALEIEAAGRLSHVTRGMLVPIASGEIHHYLAPGDNRVLVLDLPEAWCETLSFEILLQRPARRLPEPLVVQGARLGNAGQAVAHWLELVLEGVGRCSVPPRLKLLDLLPAIRDDLAHPWRVAEMARRCHLAEAVFARQFRALTGLPPHEWLLRQRMTRACELLMNGNASLTEVAQACGFADSAHFSRSFRCRHGVSPSEWRRVMSSGNSTNRQDSTSHSRQ